MNKTVLCSFTILCLSSLAFLVGFEISVKGTPELSVRNLDTLLDYETIQEAIDAPATLNGHTIFVEEGTYYEKVLVNKSLSLIGENQETTIIDGNFTGTVVNVTANNVKIAGFRIQNSDCGIFINQYNARNNISYNLIANNNCGIWLDNSSNNNILRNSVLDNFKGMQIEGITNTLSGNNVTNSKYGIRLFFASNNTLSENMMNNNAYNFDVFGYELSHYLHSIDISNLINGKPIYYLVNQTKIDLNSVTHSQVGYLALVDCVDISIKNLTLTNNLQGLLLAYTNNSLITDNNVINNTYGIYLRGCYNNSISESNMVNNDYGIWLWYSSNNNMYQNNITRNHIAGIFLYLKSANNTAFGNNITYCHYGIDLSYSSNNTLKDNNVADNSFNFQVWGESLLHFIHDIDASNTVNGKPVFYCVDKRDMIVPLNGGYVALVNCTGMTVRNLNLANNSDGVMLVYTANSTITKNNITNNEFGIGLIFSSGNTIFGNYITNNVDSFYIKSSSNNTIYHNNIINNQYPPSSSSITNSNNVWDNGYPSGGNFWSDYSGSDADNNGISDTPYVIIDNDRDNYPLMGMFSSFNTSLGYYVNAISNSTIEDFEYFGTNSTIKMYVSGEEGFGFCRVSIPHVLMNVSDISVVIDDGLTPVLYHNYTLYDNGTHRWIYFAYEHSTHEIDIIPEFPSFLILPLFMITTLLTVIIYGRKHTK